MKEFEELKFERINTDLMNEFSPEKTSYKESYPEFINYFERIDEIEKEHFIISSYFTYGSVSTKLKLNTQEINMTLRLLNHAKEGEFLTENDLSFLKKVMNNSMTGLSKLLHYIKPNTYALFDAKIYEYITGGEPDPSVLEKPEVYRSYLSCLHRIAHHKDYQDFHDQVQKHYDYSITPMRAIEQVMYEALKQGVVMI